MGSDVRICIRSICVTPSTKYSVCKLCTSYVCMYANPPFCFFWRFALCASLVAKKCPLSLSGEEGESRQHPAPNLWHLVWLAVVACFRCLIGEVGLIYTAVQQCTALRCAVVSRLVHPEYILCTEV